MIKKILPVVFLAGLVAWGIYDHFQTNGSGAQENTSNENQNAASTDSENKDDNDDAKKVTGIKQGNIAPDFTLETMDGQSVKLSDFKGKNIIVNFWATWCPPCRAEMPEMQEYYEANKDKDFVILAVNMTKTEKSQMDVKQFVEEDFELTFPVVMDLKHKVTNTYEVTGYPTSYFIDKEGVIQYKVVGAMNQDVIKRQIAMMNQ
ncbi:peroxiredoxin [Bacillus sp. Marseille-Q3570]|uniref:peroxiredoxin family protein n=1 Tax=Bacillus sp. Marseille-Q3570 TaxID=2963522 RepID=UPI0021B83177|nr:TlpA disulfide reductase family protein [Bacillus sp. Marseille-Q3570]